MFTKVLVGVDGRDGGRDAIALAADLGGPRAHYVLANAVATAVPGRAGAFTLAASCPVCGGAAGRRAPSRPDHGRHDCRL